MATGDGRNSVAGRGPMCFASRDVEVASGLVRRIEDFEASKRCLRVEDVRPEIARHLGITTEALRNVRTKKRKQIPAWFMSALWRAWIEVLQGALAQVEHDRMIWHAMGIDPRDDAFSELRVRAAALHHLLESSVETG